MDEYEEKQFVAKTSTITLADLLDMWAEEELQTSSLSNGIVNNYLQAIKRIKQPPTVDRKLK